MIMYMTSTRLLTKQDLLELVDEIFPDTQATEKIAVLFTTQVNDHTNQCILLNKEVPV